MTQGRALEEFPNPIETIECLLSEAFQGFFPDLEGKEHYLHEHEVVNLFVFGHLVPLFIKEGIDLTQIGIEFPISKHSHELGSKPRARKDLVIWSHPGATLWQGRQPLAVIEWKHSSGRKSLQKAATEHKSDIDWLLRNTDRMTLGFAVLVQRTPIGLRLSARKVTNQGDTLFISLPTAQAVSGG
jgi:hypothetical protein